MVTLLRQEHNQGTICKIDQLRIWVALEADCATNRSKNGCGGGCISCAAKDNVRKASIPVTDSSSMKLGQQVSFSHYVPNESIAGFIVFGVPIFLALLNIFFWYLKAPQSIESSMAIITTGIAFFSGFALLKILDSFFRKRYPAILAPTPDNLAARENG